MIKKKDNYIKINKNLFDSFITRLLVFLQAERMCAVREEDDLAAETYDELILEVEDFYNSCVE